MKYQLAGIIVIILISVAGTVHATGVLAIDDPIGTKPTANDVFTNEDLAPDSRLRKYFNSREFLKQLFDLGMYWDRKVLHIQPDCSTGFKIVPVRFGIIQPVTFPVGAVHPTQGMWMYRYRFDRCDESIVYNALVIAREDLPPQAVPIVPGETLADPVLIKDILQPIASLGVARISKDSAQKASGCEDTAIRMTEITIKPHAVDFEERTVADAWEERWTINACGETAAILVCFLPNNDGGTDWMAPKGCAGSDQL